MSESLSAQAALLGELVTESMGPALEAAGISLAGFELLSAVDATGGKATQIDVARRLGITAPSLSEAVRSAVKRGLIEQVAVKSDARTRRLKVTAEGRAVLRKVLSAVTKAETVMAQGIPEDEIARAVDVLKRANVNLARMIAARDAGS